MCPCTCALALLYRSWFSLRLSSLLVTSACHIARHSGLCCGRPCGYRTVWMSQVAAAALAHAPAPLCTLWPPLRLASLCARHAHLAPDRTDPSRMHAASCTGFLAHARWQAARSCRDAARQPSTPNIMSGQMGGRPSGSQEATVEARRLDEQLDVRGQHYRPHHQTMNPVWVVGSGVLWLGGWRCANNWRLMENITSNLW